MSDEEKALSAVLEALAEMKLDVPADLIRQIYEAEARVQYLDDRGDIAAQVTRFVDATMALTPESS